jgi:ribosomal-protein-alanine N-acetyltransferase
LRRLEAAITPANVAGRRLLTKTGFLPIGLARQYRRVDHVWSDHVLYEKLLAEPADASVLASVGTDSSLLRPSASFSA